MTMKLLDLSQAEKLAARIIQEAVKAGVLDFCLCPGARNYQLASQLSSDSRIHTVWCMDERSAAFLALGLSRKNGRPVAVITTSWTAVGEMLPAAMEAYYTGVPLLLISADRPLSHRYSGGPQTAEQVNIFGQYAPFQLDIESDKDPIDLSDWNQNQPAHLNVCFDEPLDVTNPYVNADLAFPKSSKPILYSYKNWNVDDQKVYLEDKGHGPLDHFLAKAIYPFVVVGGLKEQAKEAVAQFLLKLQAPVFLEAISGLREDKRLASLRIGRTDKIWQMAEKADYPIDAVLRIGGVPTFRYWRDLEDRKTPVFSINDVPFTGISYGTIAFSSVQNFLQSYEIIQPYEIKKAKKWLDEDSDYLAKLHLLCRTYPDAELSLFYHLSKQITEKSQIFLGNSLPIREWDLAAVTENKGFSVFASRGLNGIDGQIAAYLGMLDEKKSNWGIFGDLTTIYDMNSLWYLPQLDKYQFQIVVVNNQGGKIFAGKFSNPMFQNNHPLRFEHLANFWKIDYAAFETIPESFDGLSAKGFIELLPNPIATEMVKMELAKL